MGIGQGLSLRDHRWLRINVSDYWASKFLTYTHMAKNNPMEKKCDV